MTDKKIIHKNLAAGKWHTMSFAEQMGNIGSEVSRAAKWQEKADLTTLTVLEQASSRQDKKTFWGAVERGLELFDLTLEDPRWKESSLREVGRAREVFVDGVFGGKMYKTDLKDLNKYFLPFGILAMKKYS